MKWFSEARQSVFEKQNKGGFVLFVERSIISQQLSDEV